MKLREFIKEMAAASSGGGAPAGPGGPSGPPSGDPAPSTPVAASTGKIGSAPPGGGQGLSGQGTLKSVGVFIGHETVEQKHDYTAKSVVGKGIEWTKPTGTVSSDEKVHKETELETPGEHHSVGHDGEGVTEEATAGATASGDIATVAYPLFVRGRNRKEKRANARRAVGQKSDNLSGVIGRGVFEQYSNEMLVAFAERLDESELKDGIVAEIDRRGFLKGLGAAAAAAAVPGLAKAAPFSHGTHSDQMTAKVDGNYSIVKSDNSNATLIIQHETHSSPAVLINIPRTVIMSAKSYSSDKGYGRIKIGGRVYDVQYWEPNSNAHDRVFIRPAYNSGISDRDLISLVATTPGELFVEVPIYQEGNVIYKFTIEPDQFTKDEKAKGDAKTKAEQAADKKAKAEYSALLKTAEENRLKIKQYVEALPLLDRYNKIPVDVRTDSFYTLGTTYYKEYDSYRVKELKDWIKASTEFLKSLEKPKDDSKTTSAADVGQERKKQKDDTNNNATDSSTSWSPSYRNRIQAVVKPNIIFADNTAGVGTAEVGIKVASDGTILGKRLVTSSGNPAWDNAVLRAIDRTARIPKDVNGKVPPTARLRFTP